MSPRTLLAPVALALHRLMPRRGGLRILLLHHIPDHQLSAFAALVSELAASDRLIGPDRAEAAMIGEEEKVLISFDDGFASNLAAAEILESYGSHALFFVCPGLMELKGDAQAAAISANIFDGKRSAEGLRLMTWDEIARLAAAGHTIANHTLSHRRLSRLTPGEMEAEIGGGAGRLAERLGRAGEWFAFPFGDVASVTPAALAVAGRYHPWCRSGVRGKADGSTHRLALPADHLDLGATRAWRALVVEGGLDPLYRRRRTRLAAMVD